MSHASRILMAAAVIALGAANADAQQVSYRLVDGWAQLPDGVEAWGQTIGMEMAPDGSLWVFQRCFANNCVDGREGVTPMLKYDPSGRLVDSWGAGMFVWPHGSTLDAEGNLWTTDAQGREGIGHQVFTLRPEDWPKFGRLKDALHAASMTFATPAE